MHTKVLYALGYTAGLRKGEIFNLMWSDIDFTTGEVVVNNRKGTRDIPHFLIKDYEQRRVPLPETTLNLLTKLQAESDEHIPFIVLSRSQYETAVSKWKRYCAENRAWRNEDMLNNSLRDFKRHYRRAGIKPLGTLAIHTLRKSCIKNWADRIPNPEVVRRLAGHGSIVTTMRYYNQVTEADREQAKSKVDAMLNEAEKMMEVI